MPSLDFNNYKQVSIMKRLLTLLPTFNIGSCNVKIGTNLNLGHIYVDSSRSSDGDGVFAVCRTNNYPTDGRWTRRDPIGIEGGINYYAFVNNYQCLAVDIIGLDLLSQIGKKCKKGFNSATQNAIKLLLKKACGKESGSSACEQAQQKLMDLINAYCCNGSTGIDDTMPWSNNPPETNPNDKTASASKEGVYGKVSGGVNTSTGVSAPKYRGGKGNRSGIEVNFYANAPVFGGQASVGVSLDSNGGVTASIGWGISF